MADPDIVIRVRTDGTVAAETALKRLGDAGVRTEVVTDSMAKAFARNTKAVEANVVAMRTMQSLGVVTFLSGMALAVTKLSDKYTDLTNKLVNANSAHESLAVVQQRVFDIAQRSRTSLEATATLYARLERSLSSYGATGENIARITETVSKAMIISGATAQEAAGSIIQLSQGLQSGVLRGQEYNSVAEQAPRLLKVMADHLKVTTGELRKMASEGKLTADIVATAIYASSDAIDKEFSKTVATFSQKMTVAENELIKFAGTSSSIGNATSLLGDGVVALSKNLDTVSNVVGIVALAFTGKLLSALASSQAASLKLMYTEQSEIATAKALSGSRVQNAASAVTNAKATLELAVAEREAALAAFQSNQATYKGVDSMRAYYTAKNQTKVATAELAIAENTLANATTIATTRARIAAAAMTTLKTAMSFLGGPVGIIMIAAAALYEWNQRQEQAVERARDMGLGVTELTEKFKNMTQAQLEGYKVELKRSQLTLTEQYRKEKAELTSLNEGIKTQQGILDRQEGTYDSLMRTNESLNNLRDLAKTKAADLSTTEGQLDSITQDLNATNQRLIDVQSGAVTSTENLTAEMRLQIDTAKALNAELDKAVAKQAEQSVAMQYRLSGDARSAEIYTKALSGIPLVMKDYADSVKAVISGADITQILPDGVEDRIRTFVKNAGDAYDINKKLDDQRRAAAQGKKDATAQESAESQWQKALERTTASGEVAFEKLRIQQEAEIRLINEKADKAKASAEERNQALLAIEQKYTRARQDISDQYDPAGKLQHDYERAIEVLDQLRETDLEHEAIYNEAKLKLQGEYIANKIKLSEDAAVSEEDAIRAIYNPVKAAENEHARLLAGLTAAHDAGLVEDGRFFDLRHQYYTDFLQKQAMAENAVALNFLDTTSQMAGDLAGVLSDMGKRGSAAYRALFAASKSFAIAEATIKLTTAISQAMADPTALTPAQKFANYLAVASTGAALIHQITSATMTGMAHDGITNIPQEGTWLLQKGERVLSAQQNADFTSFMSNGGPSKYNSGGGSGGPVTIVQHITVTGNGDKNLQDAMEKAAERGAEQGYNRVLQDTNSRGNISRSIGR